MAERDYPSSQGEAYPDVGRDGVARMVHFIGATALGRLVLSLVVTPERLEDSDGLAIIVPIVFGLLIDYVLSSSEGPDTGASND